MSSAIEINGITLIPGKEAAKKAGYSSDYIARLAREQKIVGTQIDRQWFIDSESLNHFLESAKIDKVARKRKLQAERAMERSLRESKETIEKKHQSHVHTNRLPSLVISGLAALLVTMVGVSAINLYNNLFEAHSKGVQNVAQVSVRAAAPIDVKSTLAKEDDAVQLIKPTYTEASVAQVSSTTFGEGVLVLAPETSTTSITEIQELFSDPVAVELIDGQTGKVRVTSDETETVYPVVIVPNID